MANALKKITTAAKAYRKKHPGASWKSAVKKAGAEYRAGKLKTRRKRVASVGAVKRKKKTVKRKAGRVRIPKKVSLKTTRTINVVNGTKKRRRKKSASRKVARRRVGSSRQSGKDKLIQTLLIGGLGVGLLVAFTRQRQQPVYYQTGNQFRDSAATRILNFAAQASLTAQQIAMIISKLNTSNDAQLQQMIDAVDTGNAYALTA